MRYLSVLGMLLVFALSVPTNMKAQIAPDAIGLGPYLTTFFDYKLPAGVDPDILAAGGMELQTELWARVHYPIGFAGAPLPLIIFLHGNHATCGRDAGAGPGRFDVSVLYTFTGTCPQGYVPVPNHLGYEYLAQPLASWGYIVVSLNANRGINGAPGVFPSDRGLNKRRGRLVLRHLWQLYQWHAGTSSVPDPIGLAGKINFSQVGMMGHSRGGEGVRAAYNFYRDPTLPTPADSWQSRIPGLVIRAIFEIGPVDRQTDTVFNVDGTVWNVLLPMCDGDVFTLVGMHVFDRALQKKNESPPTQKSTFTVWGANHNFYNTEWQLSDSPGCLGHKRLFGHLLGSPPQRTTALSAVMALFRGNLPGAGFNPAFNRNFNPQFALPATVTGITRVDRGYTDSPSSTSTKVFDDFNRDAPFNTNDGTNVASNISYTHGRPFNHDLDQRAAIISWSSRGKDVYFQTNWTAPGSGMDVSSYHTLDFRISRQCGDPGCLNRGPQFWTSTNFSIRLTDQDGDLSGPVQLKDYLDLTGPVGGLVTFFSASPHPILQTVRIPLSVFGGFALSKLRGIRFTFDDTQRDEIYLANIRLSSISALPAAASPPSSLSVFGEEAPLDLGDSGSNDVNHIKSIRTVGVLLPNQKNVEIELSSNRQFLPKDELLVLHIGSLEFADSRYSESDDTATVIFTLTTEEFARIQNGDPVTVQYGTNHSNAFWRFGNINKNQLVP